MNQPEIEKNPMDLTKVKIGIDRTGLLYEGQDRF
jgi:hypothetical protein